MKKTRFQKTTLFFSLFLGALYNSPAATQRDNDKVGEVSSSFLQINPSVRTAALGGSQAAVYGNMESVYSNPAGLTALAIPELWLSHNQSFIQTKYNTFGFGLPLKSQSIAFSAQYIDEGSFEKINVDSNNQPVTGLGNFRFSTMLLQGTWAKVLWKNLSLGATAKGWKESREYSSSQGWAANFGIQMRSALPSLDLGLAFRNMGPRVDGHPLPASAAVGAAYRTPFKNPVMNHATAFSEYETASFRDPALRGGVEFGNDMVWLRCGYENLTSAVGDELAHFNFGAGLRIKGIKLDYAWVPKGDLGDQHRLAFTVGFGMTPEERERASRELDLAIARRMNDRSEQYFTSGQKLAKEGRWKEAQAQFEQSLQWNHNNTQAKEALKWAESNFVVAEANQHYQQGLKLAEQKQWLDATLQFSETLKLNSAHKAAQKALKEARNKIREPQAVKNNASQTMKEAYDRGVRYYLEGQFEAAIQEWNRVLRQNPEEPFVRENIEKAEKMKLAQELKTLRGKQKSADAEIETLSQQAYTLYMLDQTEKAIVIWQRILLVDPNNADVKRAIEEARAKQKLSEAHSGPGKPNKIYELNAEALSAYNSGDLERATQIWRRILDLNPGNVWIKNNLKRVESELVSQKGVK